ncbi:MAG TPA: hypothetical protein VMG80_07455, partial [Solirubrobacteraceae bacterium]|nr:hypothetical protein [Solirubrobacteraceae bacterium]
MALRLTGIPTPDDAAGTPGGGLRIAPLQVGGTPAALSGAAFCAQLRDQARLQLAFNQLEPYQALFARA